LYGAGNIRESLLCVSDLGDDNIKQVLVGLEQSFDRREFVLLLKVVIDEPDSS
jgi:hypothetical protein